MATRTHDAAIRALRREALRIEKRVQDGDRPDGWRHVGEKEWRTDKEGWKTWEFALKAKASAFSLAAEFLDGITGTEERKAAKAKGRRSR